MWFKVNEYSSTLITSVFGLFMLPLIGLGQHQGHQMSQSSSPAPNATPSPSPSGTHTHRQHPSFRIGAYTFGGVRDVWTTEKVELGIGSDLTFYSKPSFLDTMYGNRPISWKVFFRIRPGRMDMTMHSLHGTNGGTNKPSR